MKTQIWQGILLGRPFRILAEDFDNYSVLSLEELVDEGFFTDLAKGVVSFAKAHPLLTTYFGARALSTWAQYKKAANANVVRLYAKPSEQAQYQKMMAELKKDGWKLIKTKYTRGSGYEWELQKR